MLRGLAWTVNNDRDIQKSIHVLGWGVTVIHSKLNNTLLLTAVTPTSKTRVGVAHYISIGFISHWNWSIYNRTLVISIGSMRISSLRIVVTQNGMSHPTPVLLLQLWEFPVFCCMICFFVGMCPKTPKKKLISSHIFKSSPRISV